MAQGDFKWFDTFPEQLGDKLHDLENDVFKFALVNSTTTPTHTTADPRWGAGGTTNFSSNEVSGSGYTAGGIDVAMSITRAAAVTTINGGTNPTWTQNGSGPTDIRWGILYNETSAAKYAIGWVDWGAVRSLVDGNISYTWNGSGMGTLTRS